VAPGGVGEGEGKDERLQVVAATIDGMKRGKAATRMTGEEITFIHCLMGPDRARKKEVREGIRCVVLLQLLRCDSCFTRASLTFISGPRGSLFSLRSGVEEGK
jgi:hypothetical protein